MAVNTTKANKTSTNMKPTLGLTGVTINAMALIAPGAFLWTTYQLQAAPGSALNMWFAVLVVLRLVIVANSDFRPILFRFTLF